MKHELEKKELKRKAESIKGLVDDILSEKIDVPDNALIIDFDATQNIFTKKRIELLDTINSYQPASVQELSDLVKRKKQAVDRDLKMLEEFDVITLEKRGKFTVPTVKREIIILSIKKPKPQTEIIISAEVYVDSININKIMEIPQ
ncbi:MAG: hypothetical protein Q8Q01_05485 [archaeon]|nr:hypothetical protein [archaeon]